MKPDFVLIKLMLLCSSLALLACGTTPEKEKTAQANVIIYAAAGTRMAVEEICNSVEKNESIAVERNYASSGTLARQIAAGAQADVFVSANRQWMDFLTKKQLLKPGSVKVIAHNSLVVIAPNGATPPNIEFTKQFPIDRQAAHMVIGDPAYVPVGKYTHEAFAQLGWNDALAGKLVLAKDVSSVLHYVELGECELGVVYRSEAMQSKKVQVVGEIPQSLHRPIVFYVAELQRAGNSTGAASLASRILRSGQEVFLRNGFLLDEQLSVR